jgi:hypothetical protein
MPVDKETLRQMIEDFDLTPMSDEELEIVLPTIQTMVDGMRQVSREVDLSTTRTSHVFRADTGRRT